MDEKLNAEPDIRQVNTFMDIYKRKKIDTSKSNDLEEINRFNLSIIKNNKWGTDSFNKGRIEPKTRLVIKPSQKALEKELGKKYNFFIFKSKINYICKFKKIFCCL